MLRYITILLTIFSTSLFANSLSLEDNGNGTWNVNYDSSDDIGGFQFGVDGASINSASGGDATANGFMISASGTLVLGFSLTGSVIPAGEGVLVQLDLSNAPSGLSGIVVSDASGNSLDFTFSSGDVVGCMDETACNYNPNANVDDGECSYSMDNYDCDGNCTAVVDCAGECGGSASEDACGDCGGNVTDPADCSGNLEPSVSILSPSDGDEIEGMTIIVEVETQNTVDGDHYHVSLDGSNMGMFYTDTFQLEADYGSHELTVNLADGSHSVYDGVSSTVSFSNSAPATSNGVEVSFGIVDMGAGSMEILFSSDEDIAGFQFSLSGVEITGASGGVAEANGFMMSASGSTVIGFSLTGSTIPAGSGVLCNLAFSSADAEFCFESGVFSDASGVSIDNTLGACFSGTSGCMDMDACNYNADATVSDGSCAYGFDCAGDCGGNAMEDCAGECSGNAMEDCAGVCNGSSVEDNCGSCDSNSENDCVEDCNGVWGGDAVNDECGVCDGSGIADGACDCEGNVLDCNDVCNIDRSLNIIGEPHINRTINGYQNNTPGAEQRTENY